MASPGGILEEVFPHTPTKGQRTFFKFFDRFMAEQKPNDRPVLLLRGYAGTGKTTMVSAIVKAMPRLRYKYILLAPTGRAAKVMAAYSGRRASTIHKLIYQPKGDRGALKFRRQKNFFSRTIFVVDEASMLSDDAEFGSQGLLSDLMDFVFECPNNKLLLVGDGAQLPPVGKRVSPGLEIGYLRSSFPVHVDETELTEVTRQQEASGILFNATALRNQLFSEEYTIVFQTNRFKDIYKMTGERLEDGLKYAYDKYGQENTIVITRSNKSAVQYNEYIRRTIHFYDNELEVGDFLMVVRNNYHYVPDESPVGFLANGDFAEVVKIKRFEDEHGFRFADLEVRMLDYPDQDPLSVKVTMDTLHSATPAMSQQDNQQLYERVLNSYADLPKGQRIKAMREDDYLNAVQVKFAYALTCHKSQGGQWDAVFVDQGYLTDDMIDREYLRWLYTAVTRATKELFLVNFNPRFFG